MRCPTDRLEGPRLLGPGRSAARHFKRGARHGGDRADVDGDVNADPRPRAHVDRCAREGGAVSPEPTKSRCGTATAPGYTQRTHHPHRRPRLAAVTALAKCRASAPARTTAFWASRTPSSMYLRCARWKKRLSSPGSSALARVADRTRDAKRARRRRGLFDVTHHCRSFTRGRPGDTGHEIDRCAHTVRGWGVRGGRRRRGNRLRRRSFGGGFPSRVAPSPPSPKPPVADGAGNGRLASSANGAGTREIRFPGRTSSWCAARNRPGSSGAWGEGVGPPARPEGTTVRFNHTYDRALMTSTSGARTSTSGRARWRVSRVSPSWRAPRGAPRSRRRNAAKRSSRVFRRGRRGCRDRHPRPRVILETGAHFAELPGVVATRVGFGSRSFVRAEPDVRVRARRGRAHRGFACLLRPDGDLLRRDPRRVLGPERQPRDEGSRWKISTKARFGPPTRAHAEIAEASRAKFGFASQSAERRRRLGRDRHFAFRRGPGRPVHRVARRPGEAPAVRRETPRGEGAPRRPSRRLGRRLDGTGGRRVSIPFKKTSFAARSAAHDVSGLRLRRPDDRTRGARRRGRRGEMYRAIVATSIVIPAPRHKKKRTARAETFLTRDARATDCARA